MNRLYLSFACLAALSSALLSPAGLRAQSGSYNFSSFDFPGAVVTQAYGINATGDIVGTYQNAAPENRNHGFLLTRRQSSTAEFPGKRTDDSPVRAGAFATLDFPGGNTAYSLATAIGPDGDIVGYYGLVGGAPTSAFGFQRDKHAKWTTVANSVDPIPTMTPSAFRILPDGTMVGCFHYANAAGAYTSMHGFTLARDGSFSRFDYPAGISMSMHYGATPDGKMIVGVYTAAGVNHGYILSGDAVTSFDVPNSVRTTPQDINPAGVIVGTYRSAGEPSTTLHSFLLDTHRSTDQSTWQYTLAMDVPGASITRIRGINARGDLVGDYIGSDGKNHGFFASRNDRSDEREGEER